MPQAQNWPSREDQLTAEYHADLSVEQVAAVYAQALLGAAEKAGQAEAVIDELRSLVVDVLGPMPQLEAVLLSPMVRQEDKQRLVARITQGRASALLSNFLQVVARRGRLDLLTAICRQVLGQLDRLRSRVRVLVETAVPLPPEELAGLRAKLASALESEPVVIQQVRPELIGGAVLRIGDRVYDASVAGQLENLREQMVERSIHEIQSRRDRFRSPN